MSTVAFAALQCMVFSAMPGCVGGSPGSSTPSAPVVASGTDCTPAQVGDRCGTDKGWPAHIRCNGTTWLTVQVCPQGMRCETTVNVIGCVAVEQTPDASPDGANDSGGQPTCPPVTKNQYDPDTGKLVSCAAIVADAGGGDSASAVDLGKVGDAAPEAAVFDGGVVADAGSMDGAVDTQMGDACKANSTGLDKWFNCEPKPSASGKLHGEACTKDDECLYGHCMFGLPVAYYDKSIGVCTKNCGYVGGGSQFIACAAEENNPPGAKYYCTIEKLGGGSGNAMRDPSLPNIFKMCSRGCKTDGDCAKGNPALPTCLKVNTKELSVNPNGVCVKVK